MSPHGRDRERWLFIAAIDRDRVARLYTAVNGAGEVGTVAIQPDGSCWIVRDFEDPSANAWRGEG